MKKYLTLLLMALLPVVASAYDAYIDGIYYSFSGNTSTVTGYYSRTYSGAVIIPESVTYNGKTYSVTSIGSFAFEYCSGLTSVTIPSSVTSIGQCAFVCCEGLTSITIPNSVTRIGDGAFEGCCGLTSVNVASGNSKYDSRNNCNAIIETAINTLIAGCKNTIIPNSVTSIGYGAFGGCSGLTSITIPNSVTSIRERAFIECYGLTSITISNSVTSIANWTFMHCRSLTSVNIPNSLTSIGEGAFWGCHGLTSVTIPNNVTSIGSHAFYDCSGLTSVTIPESVTSIGSDAFYCCSSLQYNKYDEACYLGNDENPYVVLINSMSKDITACNINAKCKVIYGDAFNNCSGLTSITIPNSVTSISYSAFYRCSGLTSVTIGSGMESIGSFAFTNCPELTDVFCYAEEVPYTNSNAFEGSHIEYATLHVPVESIEKYRAAKPWSSFGTIVAIVGTSNINFADANVKKICVDNWDTNGDGELGEDEAAAVTSIGVVFQNKTSITSFDELRYFSGLTSIGSNAFNGCSGLTSIFIGNKVTSIGKDSFKGCLDLAKVIVPDMAAWCNISFANNYANPLFYATHLYRDNGTEITELVIPDGVTSIQKYAFYNCSSLTSVLIPEDVTSIGDYAFLGCSSLASIDIPSGVTSIGKSAFNSCTGVAKITISNSVTSIGDYAFSNCSGLTNVYCYSEKVPSTSSNAFNNTPVSSATLHVPEGSIDKYKAASPWSGFGTIAALSDEVAVTEVKALPVLIQSQGGTISIQGAAEGTPIAIYDIDGKEYGSAIAEKDSTTIGTSLRPGTVAIVKIGEKAIKVVVK